ncbi:MAG: hypothetical protein GY811_19855 [Myxococcales bacterium]|nr:hypothetical protein [Myxococcales bacterium]
MVPLVKIFQDLDEVIGVENQQRRLDDDEPLEDIEIRVLGQMSLLTNEAVSAQITLVGTLDVDASVTGGCYSWVGKKFSELLEAQNLELDRYSDEIWLPEGAAYVEIFSGKYLTCLRLHHLDALESKAVKAPEKNRLLIQQALPIYPVLEKRLMARNIDITYFEDAEDD